MTFQYQSFPDSVGMVDSKSKLCAFKIPNLRGKKFLDVGCNEGFYCGHAISEGASEVVGLDSSVEFISRAQSRFPKAKFLIEDWGNLPADKFDVVLFASAMHYLSDEQAVITQLSKINDCLGDDGVLVLETGVSNGVDDWLIIKRNDGTQVMYPNERMLEDLIAKSGLVHRYVGISEPGDGIVRKVFHCNKFRTPLIFVIGKSGEGKTRLCYSIINGNVENYISVDTMINKYCIDDLKLPIPDIYSVNAIDIIEKVYGHKAIKMVADHLVNIVKSRADRMNSYNALVIDGLNSEISPFKEILNLTVKKLESQYSIWLGEKLR
jgi:SAM-dependent methyltransferase